MRPVTRLRVLVAVLLAAMNVLFPVHRSLPATLAATTVNMCVEGLFSFFLDAAGSPGETQTFRITTSPTGHLEFSSSTSGPFTDPLLLDVTIGSNGAGRSQFIARGMATGVTTLTATNVATDEQTNNLDVTVDQVADIILEPADPDHVLEDDPFDPEAGAKRFFPDLDSPTDDALVSRQLAVKAALVLGTPGVTVQFRFADLDDPSTDTAPADPNGPTAVDNRGTTSLSALQAQTDETGEATVDIRLPMQPGDNVKIIASCAAGYVNGLTVNGLDVRDSRGRTLPTPAAEISDMVTTWRRLHIETDSMGPVRNNFVKGVVESARETRIRLNGVRVPVTQLKLASMLDAGDNPVPRLPADQFRFGRIAVGGTDHEVLASVRNLVYIAPGNAGIGGNYVMVDDDNLDGQHTGDNDFDVPLPDMSHLEESTGTGANWFAEAFIQPVHLAGHDDVPFRLQGTDEPSNMYCMVLETPCPVGQESFDNVATEANPNYWTVYLLSAYQPGLARDGDPDDENILGGRADSIGFGAVVYLESAREGRGLGVVCEAAGVAVHELAHLLAGGGHSASGIMTEACFDGTSSFSAESLDLIRDAIAP